MIFEFQRHRVHDYQFLIKRWKSLARKAGLQGSVYCTAEEFDLYYFVSPALRDSGGVYLSAGIHGDEPGATEGLYQWAELHRSVLRELPVMVFPCLNPWGLIHNRRTDSENRDLNRCYNLDSIPRIQAQKEVLRGRRFRLAICLHEDYDAQGAYLYEIRNKLTTFGQELLAAAGFYVPIDPRATIEGRRADQGWIARKVNLKNFPVIAEAIYLAANHSDRTITTETPSEFDLSARVQAHIAMIQRAAELSFV
ncbi:MAG TPA: M14 family metallocarboxypeptidase [Chthoniobacterales bacterium]|jgi:predicted deacylase|nr:M14 family metallocarboxypeptidase [Chthoniobacterales bacterium]